MRSEACDLAWPIRISHPSDLSDWSRADQSELLRLSLRTSVDTDEKEKPSFAWGCCEDGIEPGTGADTLPGDDGRMLVGGAHTEETRDTRWRE